MLGLGYLWGGYKHSEAYGVSASGDAVVGFSMLAGAVPGAFRWTASTGMVRLMPLVDGAGAKAYGVSADGTVSVGESFGPHGLEAVRWTGAGRSGLGDLAGGDSQSSARACSGDGGVIVGYGTSAHGLEAFRWSGGVMVGLGDLAGGGFDSVGLATSKLGDVVVGRGTSALGSEAFYWTAAGGMRRLSDFLSGEGLSTAGWLLQSATGISEDGRTIVGYGLNPDGRQEAWMATLNPVPEPTTWLGLGIGVTALLRRRRR